MKRSKILSGLIFLSAISGCAHTSTIVPFHKDELGQPEYSSPTLPIKVGVYRSTRPFSSFTELGLITFHSHHFHLKEMYDQIRKDAAAKGAEAIIDVKLKSETHTETNMVHNCNPVTTCDAMNICATDNQCTDQLISEDVTTFLIEGTMIKKNLGAPQS